MSACARAWDPKFASYRELGVKELVRFDPEQPEGRTARCTKAQGEPHHSKSLGRLSIHLLSRALRPRIFGARTAQYAHRDTRMEERGRRLEEVHDLVEYLGDGRVLPGELVNAAGVPVEELHSESASPLDLRVTEIFADDHSPRHADDLRDR